MSVPLFDAIMRGDFTKHPDLHLFAKPHRQALFADAKRSAASLPRAKVYELSNDVLEVVGQTMLSPPSSLLQHFELVSLPADNIWIEFDMLAFNTLRQRLGFIRSVTKTITRFGLHLTTTRDDQNAPIQIRWWSEDKGAPTLHDVYFGWRSTIPPLFTTTSTSYAANLARLFIVPVTDAHQYYAWGNYAGSWINDPVESYAMLQLLNRTTSYEEKYWNTFSGGISPSGIGTMSFAMAIISMLDQQPSFGSASATTTTRVKTPSGTYKVVPLTIGTLSLRTSVRRTLLSMRKAVIARKPTALHSVGEHWSYRRSTLVPGCVHEWKPNGTTTQENCVKCNAMRWRKVGHLRGNASYGVRLNTHTVVRV